MPQNKMPEIQEIREEDKDQKVEVDSLQPNDKKIKGKSEISKRRRQRIAKRRHEKKKQKTLKKLELPKSTFFTQSLIFFSLFMYMTLGSSTFNFKFWVVWIAIPFYFIEVQKAINNFYDKKLRELNIPYETEQQIETKTREELANALVETSMNSNKWDSESFERKYSTIEIIQSLVYYFFASFFPGYIDKQLDIFQRENKLLQSKKRMRDLKRQFEDKKQKEEHDKLESERLKNLEDQNVVNLSEIDPDSPIIADEL